MMPPLYSKSEPYRTYMDTSGSLTCETFNSFDDTSNYTLMLAEDISFPRKNILKRAPVRPCCGSKNLSPYRHACRRRKKLLAKLSKKTNRRPK